MAPTSTAVPRRERARAATIEEIKSTALELMRETQTTDVRFTDIARVMGMTPPALYRYYGDRDELLTALITDAFDELGNAVADSRGDLADSAIADRWMAAAQAYREWARREPQQFALILGMPVPGFCADEEGPTTEAAKRAMAQLSALFIDAKQQGKLQRPVIREVDPAMVACVNDKHPELEGVLEPETFQAMLQAWAALHGITSLESYGQLDWMEPAARDALFVSQARLIAKTSGLPVVR